MSQINIRNLSNENDDGSPEIVGVSTFSATSFFVPPKGSTAERPSDCTSGSIRFNTDTANLEYFRGKTLGWSQFELLIQILVEEQDRILVLVFVLYLVVVVIQCKWS